MALKLPALKVTPAPTLTLLFTVKLMTLVAAVPNLTCNEPAPVLFKERLPFKV